MINSELGEQIEEYMIRNGLRSGDKLPSEREFCDLLHVSRMTVRESIKKLCSTGVIEAVQGKGTFVAPQRICYNLMDFSLLEGNAESNIKYKLISAEMIRAEGGVSKNLGLPKGAELYQLKRLQIFDARRSTFETSYFTPNDYAAVDNNDLALMPITHICSKIFRLKRVSIDIDIGMANQDEAVWLGISEGESITHEKMTLYKQSGMPGVHIELVACAKYVYYYANLISSKTPNA